MSITRAARPLTILLATFAVAAAALSAFVLRGSPPAHAGAPVHAGHAAHFTAAAPAATAKAVALRADMRKLWEDHVTWTRLAIISLTSDSPDTKASVARLLRNQVDIGNAVKPFYGAAAGNELTKQLRAHILIAADVIAAAKAGDKAKLAAEQARWTRNADDVAGVLASVNPRYWPLTAMKAEMHMHLKLTTAEVVDRLQHRWNADVAAYDAVHRHILHMSDMLADGLVGQFPARFR